MQTNNSAHWQTGLLLSLATATMWGFLPIIMKGAICDFDPITATWFRFTGGVIMFGLLLLWRRPSLLIPKMQGRVKWMLPLAVLCMSGNFLFLTWSLSYQSPSITQTVLQIGPPMVFLGGAFIFKEHIGRMQWIGFCFILPGLALFFNTKLTEVFSDESPLTIGVPMIMFSALCFASYSLLKKGMIKAIRPETTLFWGLAGGVVLLLLFAHPSQILHASPIAIFLLFLAMLNTFLPFFYYGEALRIWDTSRVGAIVAMPPVITVFATGLISKIIPTYISPEHLNICSVIGIFVVVGSCMMGALGKAKSKPVLLASES